MATYDGNMQGECRGQQDRLSRQGVSPAFYNQLVNSVGPDLTIPTSTTAGQHKGIQQQGSQEHPALYGQNQLKDGFGPIYAIPTFPWQPGHGQHQQNDDFGPVYATPSFPWQPVGGQWQLGHGQHSGSGHWYPWGIHPQTAMPCCPCHQVGYR